MSRLREVLPGFLIGLCILLCGLVGNGLYYSVSDLHGLTISIACVRAGYLLLLLISAAALYRSRSRQYGAQLSLWCGVFFAAIVAGAAADSWQALLETLAQRQTPSSPWEPVLYSLVFLLVLGWVRNGFRKIPPRSVINKNDPEGRKHLILFLSEIFDLRAFPNGVPEWISGSGRFLDADLATLATEKLQAEEQKKHVKFWPWEQLLRAINYHLQKDVLKAVTLIASEESIQQAPLFAKLVGAYPALAKIKFKLLVKKGPDGEAHLADLDEKPRSTGGFRFEDFTELSKAVHRLLSLLHEDACYHSDIMIDLTGGKKVTSVVAAVMTFNSSIKAQYVETEKPWNVLGYSIVTSLEAGPGT